MYYPRSFLKFILLGFMLVSAPLVYALAELILSLDRLATQSRAEVLQASQAARSSRLLFEQATTLERLARQEIILEDPALLEDYGRMRAEYGQTTQQLSLLPLEPAQLASLNKLRDQEEKLWKMLSSRERTRGVVTELADGYASLVEDTQGMLNATTQLTQRAIERLQETAAQGREKWLWLSLATVAIALALALVFAVLIARPIRQLDLAIRRMGAADFRQAVQVDGPQDLRYLGQRLDWLRTRLSELEQQQTRFLRHVSHELKTPLTAVREGAELLRDNVGGRLSAEQQEIVRIVRENTLSLQKLIEDLLTYHQARALEPATLAPVHLAEIVRRVLREQKLAAVARMIDIDTSLTPLVVVGDHEKIRTVVDNLLSNALKYSADGTDIDVTIVVDGKQILTAIKDHGIGIPRDEIPQLFERFHRARNVSSRYYGGLGLGLYIAKAIVEAHRGSIHVQSEEGDGSTFTVKLPLP